MNGTSKFHYDLAVEIKQALMYNNHACLFTLQNFGFYQTYVTLPLTTNYLFSIALNDSNKSLILSANLYYVKRSKFNIAI